MFIYLCSYILCSVIFIQYKVSCWFGSTEGLKDTQNCVHCRRNLSAFNLEIEVLLNGSGLALSLNQKDVNASSVDYRKVRVFSVMDWENI